MGVALYVNLNSKSYMYMKPMENDPDNAREKPPNFNSFNRYKAEKALAILTSHIDSIKTVNDWVEKAEVSKSWLAKAMKETHGMLPKEILQKVRYEKVVQLMQNDVEATFIV